MIIVRLDFVNGLHLEYNFPHIDVARVIFDRLCEGKRTGEIVGLNDYAGRIGEVDCANLQAVQLVDVEAEVSSIEQINALVSQVAQRARQPRRAPMPVDGGPLPRLDA